MCRLSELRSSLSGVGWNVMATGLLWTIVYKGARVEIGVTKESVFHPSCNWTEVG